MASNIYLFPSCGKPITLDDQGVYYTMNTRTGLIHSVFHLVYEDNWYLYQIQKTSNEGEICRVLMTENTDYALNSLSSDEIKRHFAKAEYAEPKGAWQVIKNSKYGFGKFTPLNTDAPIRYAMIAFSANEMLTPMLMHKAEDVAQQVADTVLYKHADFA